MQTPFFNCKCVPTHKSPAVNVLEHFTLHLLNTGVHIQNCDSYCCHVFKYAFWTS